MPRTTSESVPDPSPAERLRAESGYIARLLLGTSLLWWGLPLLGFDDPRWAVISLIVVSEHGLERTRANLGARLKNTLLGCAVAAATLPLAGPGLPAVLLAVAASVGLAVMIPGMPAAWRLAPATAVLLTASALGGPGLPGELALVLQRTVEVLAGGLLALAIAGLSTLSASTSAS